jgi:hypothetical protein
MLSDAQFVREVTLWIQIDHHDVIASGRTQATECSYGRGLTATSFAVAYRNGSLHRHIAMLA